MFTELCNIFPLAETWNAKKRYCRTENYRMYFSKYYQYKIKNSIIYVHILTLIHTFSSLKCLCIWTSAVRSEYPGKSPTGQRTCVHVWNKQVTCKQKLYLETAALHVQTKQTDNSKRSLQKGTNRKLICQNHNLVKGESSERFKRSNGAFAKLYSAMFHLKMFQ